MACTTPCISSDVGNVRGLLLNQNWIFPIKDHNQMSMILTKAILLKSKPEEWLKCKSESRSLIERKFSFEKVLSLYQSNWKASVNILFVSMICPRMNHCNFNILRYLNLSDIKPIIGVVPDNKDENVILVMRPKNFWDSMRVKTIGMDDGSAAVNEYVSRDTRIVGHQSILKIFWSRFSRTIGESVW